MNINYPYRIEEPELSKNIQTSNIKETCGIPIGIKTCEINDRLRCEFCQQFVLGFSDYYFRCTKYSTKKQKIPILNISNGRHIRLVKCLLENK